MSRLLRMQRTVGGSTSNAMNIIREEALHIEARIDTLIQIESKPSLGIYKSMPIWWDDFREHLTLQTT